MLIMVNTPIGVRAGAPLPLVPRYWTTTRDDHLPLHLVHERRDQSGWAAAFGVLGALLTGLGSAMTVNHPFAPAKPHTGTIFGEPSLILAVILLAAAGGLGRRDAPGLYETRHGTAGTCQLGDLPARHRAHLVLPGRRPLRRDQLRAVRRTPHRAPAHPPQHREHRPHRPALPTGRHRSPGVPVRVRRPPALEVADAPVVLHRGRHRVQRVEHKGLFHAQRHEQQHRQ